MTDEQIVVTGYWTTGYLLGKMLVHVLNWEMLHLF